MFSYKFVNTYISLHMQLIISEIMFPELLSIYQFPVPLKPLRNMHRRMGKPSICIGETLKKEQISFAVTSNCEADQRLCFRYTDSTIPLLSKSKISSL